MVHVLLTGGSGFIASHILEQLLEQGHTVTTTVRSESKAKAIRDAHKERCTVLIVPDAAQHGAFDEAVKTDGIEVVMHTASPFHFKWTDAQTELIDPAVNGTNGILKAIKQYAPQVRRLIVTSSFASILQEEKLDDPNTTFTEKHWNPVTLDDKERSRPTAYRISKKLAEKACWDFVENEKPNFDLVTICPPLVVGPVVHHLATLDAINTSNERFVGLLRGQWKDEVPGTGPVEFWIDVRDTAKAHVLAMDKQEASGKRLFTTAGYFSNREILNIAKKNFPELQDRFPGDGVKGGESAPKDKICRYDNSETEKILGFKWTGLEDSVVEVIKSIKGMV